MSRSVAPDTRLVKKTYFPFPTTKYAKLVSDIQYDGVKYYNKTGTSASTYVTFTSTDGVTYTTAPSQYVLGASGTNYYEYTPFSPYLKEYSNDGTYLGQYDTGDFLDPSFNLFVYSTASRIILVNTDYSMFFIWDKGSYVPACIGMSDTMFYPSKTTFSDSSTGDLEGWCLDSYSDTSAQNLYVSVALSSDIFSGNFVYMTFDTALPSYVRMFDKVGSAYYCSTFDSTNTLYTSTTRNITTASLTLASTAKIFAMCSNGSTGYYLLYNDSSTGLKISTLNSSFAITSTTVIRSATTATDGRISYYNSKIVCTFTTSLTELFYAVSSNGGSTWTISADSATVNINDFKGNVCSNGTNFVWLSSKNNGSQGGYYSSDAITWTAISGFPPSGSYGADTQYVNSTYVYINSAGEVYTSTDGINWTSKTNIGGYVSGELVYFGSNYYIIYNGTQIKKTSNFSTYTLVTLPLIPSYNKSLYKLGSIMYVSFGEYSYKTTDGTTWNYTQPNLTNYNLRFIINSTTLALKQQGSSMWNYNGSSWVKNSQTASSTYIRGLDLAGVSYVNGQLLISMEDGYAYYTTDGINWTQKGVNFGTKYDYFNSLYLTTWAGGVRYASTFGLFSDATGISNFVYLAVGASSVICVDPNGNLGKVYRSTNGTSFSLVTVDASVTNAFSHVTYYSGKFYVANSSNLYSSSDGLTWTNLTSTLPNSTITGIKGTASGLFLKSSDTFYSSTNGTTWSNKGTYGSTTHLIPPYYMPLYDGWISQDINGNWIKSTDLTTWTTFEAASLVNASKSNIAVDNAVDGPSFSIGIDSDYKIYKSTDSGSTWTLLCQLYVNINYKKLSYMNGYFVLFTYQNFGGNGTSINSNLYSSDGISWKTFGGEGTTNGVTYGNSKWVQSGTGKIITS